ncbi:unnamed protein product [Brassica oleracea]
MAKLVILVFETAESSYHLCPRFKLCTGAMVKLVCKNRKTMEEIYTNVAVSNMHGKYMFVVHNNHNDEMCDVMLVKSSDKGCSEISKGREQARVILNHYNGITEQIRHANNMGFGKDVTDVFCYELIKKYHVDENEI